VTFRNSPRHRMFFMDLLTSVHTFTLLNDVLPLDWSSVSCCEAAQVVSTKKTFANGMMQA